MTLETDPQVTGECARSARRRHSRSMLSVPMLRDGVAIGVISVARTEPGPFDGQDDRRCCRPSPTRR